MRYFSLLILVILSGCQREQTYSTTFIVEDSSNSNEIQGVTAVWSKISYQKIGDFDIQKQSLQKSDNQGRIDVQGLTSFDSVRFSKEGFFDTVCSFDQQGNTSLTYPFIYNEGDVFVPTETRNVSRIVRIPLVPRLSTR